MYLGMDSDSGTLMAVKQVSLGHSGSSSTKLAEHIKSLEAEVNLLKQLDHPNIVRYLGTEKTGKVLNIFLEYVPGGSIASLLANFGSFKEPVVKLYTKQILLGLEYLHRNAIMHRDIKGANILVDNTGTVKLADFGASKKIEELVTVGSGANSVKGTPYWMAPEVITQTGHGRQADIWSVACTVIEMATGKPPWSQYGSQVSAMFHIAKSKGPPLIPHELSPECKDFLYLCFNRNWRERPSAETLLQHPFVSDVRCPTAQFLQAEAPQNDSRLDSNAPAARHQGVPGAGQMARVTQVSQVAQGQAGQPRARRQLQMVDASQGMVQVQAQNREQLPQPPLPQTSMATSQRKIAMRASAPVFSAVVAREREAAKVGVDSSANSGSSTKLIAKMGSHAPKQASALSNAHGQMGIRPSATAIDDDSDSLPSPKPTYAAAVAGATFNVANEASVANTSNADAVAPSGNTVKAVGASIVASRSAMTTATATTNNSNSSSERFNPMEEPEGIHQQAKLAIDSLKTAMGATSAGGATTASLGCRDGRDSTLASSIGGGISSVGVRASLTSASSGAASGTTKSGSAGTIGTTGTCDSAGPIVYTVAGENSNDSSIPGLPWDVRESWASGGTIGTAVGGASGASGPSGASSGMTSRTVTTSSGGTDSAGATHTTGSTVVNGRFDSSLDKSLDRGLDRSWSSTSSHDSLSERRDGRMGSINMNSLHRPRSASGVREFATPRKSQSAVPRSAASTPGQTPSRIPRPPNRHSTPMTRKSPTKLAGGRHSMPTPGRQYAERLERKQSSGMAPPPPRGVYRKL